VKEDDRSTGANVNKANLGVENFDPMPRMRVKRTDFNILHFAKLASFTDNPMAGGFSRGQKQIVPDGLDHEAP
jgi:hypothetical protein